MRKYRLAGLVGFLCVAAALLAGAFNACSGKFEYQSVASTSFPPPIPPTIHFPQDCLPEDRNLIEASDSEKDLNDYVYAVGLQPTILWINRTIHQSRSVHMPEDTVLCFGPQGKIAMASSVEVRASELRAGLQEIFSGEGSFIWNDTNTKRIYSQWFGAKGDGVVDDALAFRKMLGALKEVSGVTIDLLGKTYALTLDPGLIVPEGNGIDGSGAVILARLTGQDQYGVFSSDRHLFQMKSNTFLRNMTLDNIEMPRNTLGVNRYHIQMGDMRTGKGVRNVELEKLVIKGGYDGNNAISVWGSSSNIKIRDIHFPPNDKIGAAIAVEWGPDWSTVYDNAGNFKKGWSGHPHDVLIENIQIDALTGYGGSTDGQEIDLAKSNCWDLCGNWGIWLSAPYNVTIRNVKMGTVGTGIAAYAGDFGAYMADEEVQPLVGENILIENVTVEKATIRGFSVAGDPQYKTHNIKPNFSEHIEYVDLPVTFRNVTVKGIGVKGRNKNGAYMAGQGFMTYYTKGITIFNSTFSNFAYGMEIYGGVSDLTVDASWIETSSYGGIVIDTLNDPPSNILIKNTRIRDSNQEQKYWEDVAGISIGASYNVQVIGCVIDSVTDRPQFSGIYIIDRGIASEAYLENNYVANVNVAAGGAAYSTKSTATVRWYSKNNRAAEGIPLYFGNPPVEL